MENWKELLQVESLHMGYDSPECNEKTEAYHTLQGFYKKIYSTIVLPKGLTKELIQEAKDLHYPHL